MLSQDSLERAVHAAAITAPPRYLGQTTSTNTLALEMAAAGAPEWTVVAADHQTGGRGRLGRSWASSPGRSLLFSVVLRPPTPPERAPLLALLAAVEMAGACPSLPGACPSLPGAPVRAKWPNDLVVGERKLGGILPEARVEGGALRHVVVGVGVNVSMRRSDFPEEAASTATSLSIEGADTEAADLLGSFLARLRASYRPIDPDFPAHVLARYQLICATIGRRVRARTTAGRTIEGTAVGLDEDGGLAVEADGGRHVVAFGEVAHLS